MIHSFFKTNLPSTQGAPQEMDAKLEICNLSTRNPAIPRLAPMWQQSGTLIFCSCHGIAGFLVDELQIWIWRHFLEVLSDMTLIFIFKKEYIIFVKYVF